MPTSALWESKVKNETLMLIGAGALAVYFLTRGKETPAVAPETVSKTTEQPETAKPVAEESGVAELVGDIFEAGGKLFEKATGKPLPFGLS